MTIYSIWPAFACVMVLMLLTRLPLFERTGFQSDGRRLNAIDGARGFLALGVALHHSVIYHRFLRTGEWIVLPSRFYTLAGQLSVAAFFVTTGYLFWATIIRVRGRLDFADLMRGRFFRLAPLYLLTIGIAALIIFIRSGAKLNVPLDEYLLQFARNMAFGVLPFTNMNGDNFSSIVTAGVTWTLQYEWQFYFALPVLAIFARGSRLHLPFAISVFLLAIVLYLLGGGLPFILYAFFAAV